MQTLPRGSLSLSVSFGLVFFVSCAGLVGAGCAVPESGDQAAPHAAGEETKTAPAETGAKSVEDEPESENESVTIESTERSGGGEGRGN